MATFGKTTIGATSNGNGAGDFKRGSKFTLTEGGDLSKITCYVGISGASGTSHHRCGVYRASDGALMGTTQVVSITGGVDTTGWKDFPFASPLSLPAGDYWLVWQDEPPTGHSTSWYGDAVGTGTFFSRADTYSDGLSDPMGANTTGNANRTMSIYATYTPSTQTLDVGKVSSGETVRGIDLSPSGPATLAVGKVSSGELVRGVDLAGPSVPDGTLRDVMQRNPGAISGGPQSIPSLLTRDVANPDLRFSGGSTFSIPHSASLNLLDGAVGGIAIAFMLNLPAYPLAEAMLFEKAGEYSASILADGTLRFYLTSGHVDSAAPIPLNEDKFITLVYNGGYSGTPQVGVTTQGSARLSISADRRQGAYTGAQNIIVAPGTLLERGRIDALNLGLIRTADATSPEWLAAAVFEDVAGVPGDLIVMGTPQLIQPSETFVFQPYSVSAIMEAGDFWQGVIGGSGFAEFGPISLAYETSGGAGRKTGAHQVSDGSENFTGTVDTFGTVGASDANDKLSVYLDYTPLARTGDEGHAVICVDGQEDNRAAYTAGITAGTADLTGPEFDVKMGELLLWSRKLGPVEVAQLNAAR